jgi:gliding motility-associated-like protein
MTLGTAYTVSASNTNCTTTTTASFSNAVILTTPAAPTVNTPVNYCLDDIAVPLTVPGVNLLWYDSINGTGSIIAPTPSTTTIGSTTYYVSQTLGTCESTKTAIVVTISTISISLEAGCIDADYTLTANAATGTTFEWYQGTTLLSNTTNTLVITSPGNYRVVGTLNGCSVDATENATFIYCEIPKGISPNGDGLNDNFDLSNLKVKHLQIFNRYGMEMYSKANYKNEWNGYSDSGLNLPDGTYYYIINFESGKTKTGWVYKNNER